MRTLTLYKCTNRGINLAVCLLLLYVYVEINQNGSSDDLKQRAHLRDSVSNSNEDIPKVNWTAAEQDLSASKPEDDIPRVKWNPRTANHDDDDKDVPRVRWRARPAASQVVENGDDIPKISWKKAAPRRINEEPVPKVNWDPNMAANLSEDEISEDEVGQDEVPVVNWKAPPSGTAAAAADDEDTVPVVKWRKPVQVPESRQSASDVPVVKWNRNKQPSSPSPTEEEEEEVVPVIKWKAKQPATAQSQRKSIPSPQRQGRIPSTSPSRGGGGGEGRYERRRPSEENRETEQREQPQQRVSRLTAHQSGLQRPAHSSGSSPLRYRNTSPGQSIPTKPRDASPGQRPSLRSLSPSSPALRRSSRSPSPTTGTFNDRQILPRKLQRSPSPSRRSLVQPSTSRALASPSNSPQAVRTNHETSSSSSLPPRHQSGLPHPPSQRQLKHAQTEGTRTPPSAPKAATATAKRGLTPPGGGARSQQQPGGASGRGKLAKRVLPNTPSGQSSPQGLQLPHKSSQQRYVRTYMYNDAIPRGTEWCKFQLRSTFQ